jgi:ethanolamine ammonia-lyase large subunit
MVYRHTINSTAYIFAGLRELLAKATPPRSGDRLAGIAADSTEPDDRGAARACRRSARAVSQ